MKVNSFDPNQPEKKIEKRKNDESGFKNCVWDQSGDGKIDFEEAEEVGKAYLENELGESYKNKLSMICDFWTKILEELKFSDQKNIKQNLDKTLNAFLSAVVKTYGTNATEATNEEPVEENSGNLEIDHLAGPYSMEQQEEVQDSIVVKRVEVNAAISPIFQNFNSPSRVENLGNGKYKKGHIVVTGDDRTGPRNAEKEFDRYRTQLLADLNKYLAMQNGELEKDNNFMPEFEKRYQEAVGYGYFEDKSL